MLRSRRDGRRGWEWRHGDHAAATVSRSPVARSMIWASLAPAEQFAGDRGVAHDQDAVIMPITSGSSEEIIRMAAPARVELARQLVDPRLGADVDAARRLIEDQDLCPRRQPLGKHNLLLIASAQVADFLLQAGRA